MHSRNSIASRLAVESGPSKHNPILIHQAQPDIGRRPALRSGGAELPLFYTVAEVAAILKISKDSVIRKFSTVPGVIDLGSPETGRKRQYRVLRIPREALERFIAENRVA